MFKKIKYTVYLLLLIVVFCSSCDVKEEIERPNVVWITSEDNSIHYLKLFSGNGAKTPNIKKLADDGLMFMNTYSNAPVCSAARSTLISGCYGPRIASHYHRKTVKVNMPDGIKMYPEYLREVGYYTANCYKEDYNIFKSDNVWNESSEEATWKKRKEGQSFFYIRNFMTTHESRLHFDQKIYEEHKTTTNPNGVTVDPHHPSSDLFKYTNAYYQDKIIEMDNQVGELIKELKEDGVYENTFIFYYGDHGGVLPGSKGYVNEVGLHVPLIVRVPDKYKHLVKHKKGTRVKDFVSFIDLGPTLLSIAGIETPKGMDGSPFLGKYTNDQRIKNVAYGYADRMDEKFDMVRNVRKDNFTYIRHYQPFNYDGLMNNYRYRQLAYQEWAKYSKELKLNQVQNAFFVTKESEQLFDISNDPYETKNLANDPVYTEKLKEMRKELVSWEKGMPDLSFYPESYLIDNAFDNPVQFGQQNKDQIAEYIDLANLQLKSFEEAQEGILTNLRSEDPWKRYWALIVCSRFEKEASDFYSIVKKMAKNDHEILVRMRAAEFLGLTHQMNPVSILTEILYESNKSTEALLIANTITLLRDMPNGYAFDLSLDKLTVNVQANQEVKNRINYLIN